MKKIMLIGLVLGLLAVGCAPNLVSYPPPAINLVVVKGLQNFKISSQMPSEEYGAAFKNVIENNKNTAVVYQEKSFPIFNQMYQKYQKKDFDGMDVLIAKAKIVNAEWANSYLTLKNAYEKLGEANKKIGNVAIKTKTEQLINVSKECIEEMLETINTIRKFLDMAEGYNRSRIEKNLSFLTKENEQKYNNIAESLHRSKDGLNKKWMYSLEISIELNKLLNNYR